MIDLIVQQLNTDLVADVGLNSSYTDDKIEDIQRRLPETVATNTFIGIVANQETPIQFEIGQNLASRWEYSVDLVIMIRDGDFDNGLNKLGKILKRVVKSLSSSKVLTLQYTDGTIQERPEYMNIEKITFDNGSGNQVFLHMSVITLSIRTELII